MVLIAALAVPGCVSSHPEGTFTNACDHAVRALFDSASVKRADNEFDANPFRNDDQVVTVAVGETHSFRAAERKDVFEAMVFGESTAQVVYWGEPLTSSSDFVLEGDGCKLP